ncbi:MAG: sarcosine oxidase subunit alpha family protein [Pseudomonadota bacterium]|nr:sarcosine oxidase subunit alpha family protein [Pseudomonadota bacterium]
MNKVMRLHGSKINRKKHIKFKFNDKEMTGVDGDTLASAMLANGQMLFARSFKYHRPRGVLTAGSEEPNALVNFFNDHSWEPNTKATTIELYDGLLAKSQNHKGSLEFDFMAINDYFHKFLSAGFYYKTFMWPKSFWEKIYEPVIRSAAGLGTLEKKDDPSIYDKGFLHCDLLVIGAGPAGIMATLTAAKNGLKVILCEEDFVLGGRLNADTEFINEQAGSAWADDKLDEIKQFANVKVMIRTSVYGSFDHGIFGAVERKTDHIRSSGGKPRQILWRIYSKRSILTAGALERFISFGNNDRPGIMLSSAIRTYLNRWGVCPGKRIALFTNNNDGWRTARELRDSGCNVVAVIDSRMESSNQLDGVPTFKGETIIDTRGRKRIKSIELKDGTTIETDCLGVSGGWNPNIHLSCHQRGKPVWDDKKLCFLPDKIPFGMKVAGSANGKFLLSDVMRDSIQKTEQIVKELGYKYKKISVPKCTGEDLIIEECWEVSGTKSRSWVDLQNDVTSKDIYQSYLEGFHSVEHLKRYTTLGMATDQGKSSNVLGLAIMAKIQKTTVGDVGTTIFRPPYTPVAIGTLAGRARGKEFRPYRLTPSHNWATEMGAVFVETGNWLRAQWFPKPNEKHWRQSVDREVLETRKSVGICDVTTLGKIDIKGRDAGEFLNRVYANNFGKLEVGKTRYGLMLRDDGVAYDDGTTARLSDNHFMMTTTTANAVGVFRHLEFCRQCLWQELDVHMISSTDGWAQYAIAGPNSRKLLQKIVDDNYNIENENFPFMACGEITICGGTAARLFRISFSGELAYELAVPSRYGDSLIRILMEAGKEFNAVPYGTEALGVMRIEKGHAAGNELNGQITAQNLGMGKLISKKNDCIGNLMSEREEFEAPESLRLVGFIPVEKSKSLTAGSHLFSRSIEHKMENDEGWLSSVAYSPNLEHSIGLGFIKNGHNRIGETVVAVNLINNQLLDVEIVSPHFLDPEGERLRA